MRQLGLGGSVPLASLHVSLTAEDLELASGDGGFCVLVHVIPRCTYTMEMKVGNTFWLIKELSVETRGWSQVFSIFFLQEQEWLDPQHYELHSHEPQATRTSNFWGPTGPVPPSSPTWVWINDLIYMIQNQWRMWYGPNRIYFTQENHLRAPVYQQNLVTIPGNFQSLFTHFLEMCNYRAVINCLPWLL